LRALQEQLDQPTTAIVEAAEQPVPVAVEQPPVRLAAIQTEVEKRSPAPRYDKGAPAAKDAKTVTPKRDVKRINMDIPTDLNDLIEAEIEETGQTVKGFFVMLARQYFRNR
jgi:hypothetical protein